MSRLNSLIILLFLLISCHDNLSDKPQTELEHNNIRSSLHPAFTIDTLINTKEYLVIGNKNAEVKIIDKSDSLSHKDFIVIDYNIDKLVVAKNLIESSYQIYKKVNPNFDFESFQVELFTGKLVDPDFKSFPKAKRYITRITEECEKGINFGGKYTLVTWGCGSNCQGGVIVNRTNGKIYADYFATYGSEFRIDSSYIIFNSGLIDKKQD